jgi:hypothetical protein
MFFSRKMLPDLVPHIGMEFGNSNEAWAFWLNYGGHQGFDIRKGIKKIIRLQDYIMQICLCKGGSSNARQKRSSNKIPSS